MNVYLVQMDIAWRDKTANYAKVRSLLARQRVEPNGLIVLPEMFTTGFDVGPGDLSEGSRHVLEETGPFLSALAQETGCIVQGSGVTTGDNGKRRNIVATYAPNAQQLATYTKIHPFTFGGEHKRFESGTSIVLYEADGFQVCPFICYDLRFPEIFRHGARRGASLFCVVANWPSTRQAHWLVLLQARAIENQAYVIGVNRCGRDQHLEYAGGSVVFGPKGELLASAGPDECVLATEISAHVVDKLRRDFPALADMKGEYLGL